MCWWKLGILYELYREMELVDGNLIERSSFFQNIRFHFQSFQGGWIWLRKSKNNCLSKISGHFFWKSDILRFMGLPTRSSHLGCRFIWPNIFIWTVHDVKGMLKWSIWLLETRNSIPVVMVLSCLNLSEKLLKLPFSGSEPRPEAGFWSKHGFSEDVLFLSYFMEFLVLPFEH